METQSPPHKGGGAPTFSAMFIVSCRTRVKRLYACAQIHHLFFLVITEFGLNILWNPVTSLTLFVLKIDCSVFKVTVTVTSFDKSSAVAEMGDRGHNRHGPKRGAMLCAFRGALGTRLLIQCGLCGDLLPYQVASSSIQPFGHNSVGCHSPRMNISTNYYFVVEMHTVTVRSEYARYLLKNSTNCV